MHTEMEERLRFETLLTEISGRFVNVPADQVNGELQSKLLRVLEEGSFERLGSTKTLKVDVRIITLKVWDSTHARYSEAIAISVEKP